MMFYGCDWCGKAVDPDSELFVTVAVDGYVPLEEDDRQREPWKRERHDNLAHFHTEAEEASCYDLMCEAFGLVRSVAPSLETIPTKSGQWVAAQRRGFTRPGGGS